jgi:hypothetical protein
MSDFKFPSTLKPVVNRGYSYSRGSNVFRSQVQGGSPRQARDTFYEPVPIQVNLVVSKLGLQVFQNFLNRISGGADRFLMDLDSGNGIEEHLVQMTTNVNITTQTDVYYYVSFTATAERTSIQDPTEFGDSLVDLYDQYGETLPAFLDYYAIYCTTPDFINDL